MNSSIPLYCPDGSLYASVSEACFSRLDAAGLIARTLRHRKGHINVAILRNSPEDPTAPPLSTYRGTHYIYLQKLESGLQCWQHKKPDVMFLEAGRDRIAL